MAGHAGGHRDHVLLGDPVLDEPVRLRELERAHAAVGGQVGVEHDEARLARRELEQRLAVRGGDVLGRFAPRDTGARCGGAGAALGLALEAALALRLERRDELEGERREAERLDPLAQPAFELAGCRREVVVTGCARVPAVGAVALGECTRVLHERDALALDRPGDEDARGLLPVLPQLHEGVAEGGVVVPVARHDAAAERAQLRLEALEGEDLFGRPVRLELVAVDDHEQAARRAGAPPPGAPPSSAPPAAPRRPSSRRRARRDRGVASPRRSRAPSRSPSRASPSSPRSRARRHPGDHRGPRVAGGGAAARQGSRRARSARRRGPGRRGPSTRRRRRGRASRSRPRRGSGSPRAGGRRGRAS